MNIINVDKLQKELTAAGIATAGCNSNGVVWDLDGFTQIQDREDVAAVLAAHDPTMLSPKIQEIIADGSDVARVAFRSNPLSTILVDVLCGETPSQQTVSIDASGAGELLLTCVTPNTRIVVSANGQTVIIKAV